MGYYVIFRGWLRNPNHQLDRLLTLFVGFQPHKVVQDVATIHSIPYGFPKIIGQHKNYTVICGKP